MEISKERYEESLKDGGMPLPGMHTDTYAPEPSVRIGVRTMTLAVMDLLAKK